MKRRSFLASMLAVGVAPAVVKASSLMAVRPSGILAPDTDIILFPDFEKQLDPRSNMWEADPGPQVLTELKYEAHTEWYIGDQCVVEASGQRIFVVTQEMIMKYRGEGQPLAVRVSYRPDRNDWDPKSIVVMES